MKTKNLLSAVSLTLTLIFFFFTVSFAQGTWTQKADFPGWTRYNAVSFSIGTKGYIGLGNMEHESTPTKEFWEWDQVTNVWTRKADFPGKLEVSNVGFSIGTKGYIGTGSGYDVDIGKYGSYNDFWEYDPVTNSWTQKASLPIAPSREWAVGFSIGTKGYIGTGMKDQYSQVNFPDPNYKDFWEWDQETDVWTKKADFPGIARFGAVGFSIGDKGYIGTGWSDENAPLKDFWEWDQTTDVWIKKADFGGSARSGAVGFSIGGKGYIGMGNHNDFWEWDQVTNAWTKMADFGVRFNAVGFSMGNKGYIGIGVDGSDFYYFKDFWEYNPSITTGLKEVVYENNFFYPNPASDFITFNTSITGNSDLNVNIYNVSGVLISSATILQNQQNINISGLSNGIYLIEVKSKGGLEKQKLIVQK